jgi:hypothetical protein
LASSSLMSGRVVVVGGGSCTSGGRGGSLHVLRGRLGGSGRVPNLGPRLIKKTSHNLLLKKQQNRKKLVCVEWGTTTEMTV